MRKYLAIIFILSSFIPCIGQTIEIYNDPSQGTRLYLENEILLQKPEGSKYKFTLCNHYKLFNIDNLDYLNLKIQLLGLFKYKVDNAAKFSTILGGKYGQLRLGNMLGANHLLNIPKNHIGTMMMLLNQDENTDQLSLLTLDKNIFKITYITPKGKNWLFGISAGKNNSNRHTIWQGGIRYFTTMNNFSFLFTCVGQIEEKNIREIVYSSLIGYKGYTIVVSHLFNSDQIKQIASTLSYGIGPLKLTAVYLNQKGKGLDNGENRMIGVGAEYRINEPLSLYIATSKTEDQKKSYNKYIFGLKIKV